MNDLLHSRSPKSVQDEAGTDTAGIAFQLAPTLSLERPTARGKFLFIGDEKFWVKGVTYGTFRPDSGGNNLPERKIVARDFAAMARVGLNSIRVYTVPPLWLLDLA